MIFFTRELYDGIQVNSGWERQAERLWYKRLEIYKKYLALISPMLPPSARRFSKVSLHDGTVFNSSAKKRTIKVWLDGRGLLGPSPHRNYLVTFSGLTRLRGRVPQKNWWWLYDEIHLCSTAPFSIHVFFDKEEIEIDAAEITLEGIKR